MKNYCQIASVVQFWSQKIYLNIRQLFHLHYILYHNCENEKLCNPLNFSCDDSFGYEIDYVDGAKIMFFDGAVFLKSLQETEDSFNIKFFV